MTPTVRTVLLLLAALLVARPARAQEPPKGDVPSAAPASATPPAAGEPAQVAAPPSTGEAAPAPPTAKVPPGLDVTAGLGYYESLHAGVAWHPGGRHTLGLFVGSNFAVPKAAVNTLGLDWRYDLARALAGLDSALLVRGLYWTQRDDLYHWKLMSAAVGGSLSRAVAPGTTVTFDAAALRTFVLESDRLQDQSFGNPTKWNLTVCLSISHRVATW